MARLVGVASLFYVVGSLMVIELAFFGPVKVGEVTLLGMISFLFWGAVFLCQKAIRVDISIGRRSAFRGVLFFLSIALLLLAVYVLHRFGLSPAVAFFVGADVDVLFQGQYREQLPLRALGPPIAVAVGVLAALGRTKKVLNNVELGVIALVIVFFVATYETRYVVIWIVLYLISLLVSMSPGTPGTFRKRLLGGRFLVLLTVVAGLFVVFKYIGEARSGLADFSEEAGVVFASAMGLDPRYWNLGLTATWLIIYLFGAFARGMENEPFYVLFDFSPPLKLWPGILQDLMDQPRPAAGLMTDRFSEQAFAIDVWHTYAIYFGVVEAVVFLNCVFVVLFVLWKVVKRRIAVSGRVSTPLFFLLVWLVCRVLLSSIGDYLLDFAAVVELAAIVSIAYFGGVRIDHVRKSPSTTKQPLQPG